VRKGLLLVLAAAFVLTGCLHGRGVHTVPIERDYAHVEKLKASDVDQDVAKAHRVGAGVFAPYEMHSALHYLEWARMERAQSDRKGEWDYAALAQKYAAEAIARGGIPDKGELPMADNIEQARAEFERLKAKYLELDPCKAKLVAPVAYAHIEANLSHAEHEIIERCCHYEEGVRFLRWVEADIDAIWAHDADGDGIVDMKDGEPWIPEDADGFQDEDGIPEPKPYPELSAVHFANDSAKLTDEAEGYIKGIANMLIDGYSEATVYLAGHTDSDASDEYNMALSKRRVDAVSACLLAHGAKNGMVKMNHYGEAKPVADNKTEAGQAQNRRVEIWLDSPDVVTPYCN
jgi:outer membrane protein OmpA-like peptidoglycan-associated protein